ncbi:Asp/Glu/hydantoin racemase [Maritimibacter alkaliphilus]|uniref:maleate cis-trans isomerase family protein n=1 Tax=Maritimibacter alkaliphilus TaxID=404236 RepID=UPI001C956826|nr:Asp/Glu/hydantoin racemase [Maritimibacter alkaliphilus]MBY6091945.1 Asp/Glu/hydantoin racemase [Maritimibacter alkaliphilus]
MTLPYPYPDPATLLRVGHIMPSSNTWAEPLTYAMNMPVADRVSQHFSRTEVQTLALNEASNAHFQNAPMVAAARLLADAPLNALVWNGTSASWRGLETDQLLCEALTEATGVPATTATLGFYETYRRFGFKDIALALPYTADVSEQIVAEYQRQGYSVPKAAYLGIARNVEIGNTPADRMRALLRDAAEKGGDCIAVVCTNFPATALVAEMEDELGLPIVDSIAVTFLEACRVAGFTPSCPGWGRILA